VPGQYRPSIAFHGRFGVEHTYGGKLTENAIQALCRDLMADALVRAEDAGLCPVLHVHDEIVCEVPRNAGREGYELLKAIMLDVPEWAEGFPIGAAGHVGRRYRK
jgi:DNA polymerase